MIFFIGATLSFLKKTVFSFYEACVIDFLPSSEGPQRRFGSVRACVCPSVRPSFLFGGGGIHSFTLDTHQPLVRISLTERFFALCFLVQPTHPLLSLFELSLIHI